MANAQIPVGAKEESRFTGKFEGDTLTVILYAGKASDGYKSDFQRRPARWIVWMRVDAQGKRVHRASQRFGGKNYAKGLEGYLDSLAQLRAAGVQEVE